MADDEIPAEYKAKLAYVQSLSSDRTLLSSNQDLQALQAAARKGVKSVGAALADLNVTQV